MSAAAGRWQPERLPEDARRMAEIAARAAGLSLKQWLGRVIRAASAIEQVAPDPATSGAAQKALALLAQSLRPGTFPLLDEARAYLRLMREFGLSAGEIARGVGRPSEHVARTLKLLALPQSVRELIERRALSAEHAYALIDGKDPASLAQAASALGLAADETRQRARAEKGKA
jgi:ParB-like chromosome segregation protein Spo0J